MSLQRNFNQIEVEIIILISLRYFGRITIAKYEQERYTYGLNFDERIRKNQSVY